MSTSEIHKTALERWRTLIQECIATMQGPSAAPPETERSFWSSKKDDPMDTFRVLERTPYRSRSDEGLTR